jgi:tripartite-type tricarboxylate transporter receptor subunit TctC
MFVPKGVPTAVVEKLNDALVRAVDDETVRERMLDLGVNTPHDDQRTPQALADLVKKEVDRWTSFVKAAGIGGAN